MEIRIPSKKKKISLYDCWVFGVIFVGLGLFFFFLSIAFLVNVKVAERYEYPVINRKQEKKPRECFY